jgi:hypothetical protein
MKQFIKNILLFIPLMSIAYILLVIVWGDLAPAFLKTNLDYPFASFGHMYSRMSEAKRTTNVDLLFLGSSHAYRGFDPRIFSRHGYKTFNLGSSSQTPIQTKILLERYMEQLNPKIIVYEVYPVIFTMDGVEASLDLIANDTIDNKIRCMAKELNNIKTYNTLIYGYYHQRFHNNETYREVSDKDDDTYIPGGFVAKKLAFYSSTNINHNKKEKWIPIKRQTDAFESILKMINKKKIRLVLVQTPVTKDVFNSYSNNPQIDKYFLQKGEYYNFNELLMMNDSLQFFNQDHLNQNGVEVFNKAFMNMVLKNKNAQQNYRTNGL